MLPIEAAPINVAHVALRSFDGQVLLIENLATNLDAAVAGPSFPHQFDLKLQLKILVLFLAAKKSVEFQAVWRGPDNGPIFDAPIVWESVPTGKVLAIEEGVFVVGAPGVESGQQN